MGQIVLTSYISHGAPTSLVERTGMHDVYERFGKVLTERGVDTVVVSSPHYFSNGKFEVESREEIPCIQDYYGFPEDLYKYSYEAQNNTDLVDKIVEEARARGVDAMQSRFWGLDHGAWLPLYFMFPERNVKVVPVSINSTDPGEHFSFGKAISSAIEKTDGTFAVIGTGSPVHRLDLMRFGYYGEERFEPGERFDNKLIEIVSSGDFNKILGISDELPSLIRAAAPEGRLDPLFIALGASDGNEFVGKTVAHDFMYYSLSLVAIVLSAEGGLLGSLFVHDTENT